MPGDAYQDGFLSSELVAWSPEWPRFSSYELVQVDGAPVIRPAKGSERLQYDPLRPGDKAPWLDLSNLLCGISGLSPGKALHVWQDHPRAPKLDSRTAKKVRSEINDRARQFVESWGLLGLHEGGTGGERVRDILVAAYEFCILTQAVTAFQVADAPRREKLGSMIAYGFHSRQLPEADRDPEVYVHGLDEMARTGVSLRLPWHQDALRLGWQFSSLWQAVHLSLGLTLAQRPTTFIRRCEKERCRRIFFTETKARQYCSDECQKAHSVQAVRRRKEEARTLNAAGHSVEEIAAKVGSEVDTIRGWLAGK